MFLDNFTCGGIYQGGNNVSFLIFFFTARHLFIFMAFVIRFNNICSFKSIKTRRKNENNVFFLTTTQQNNNALARYRYTDSKTHILWGKLISKWSKPRRIVYWSRLSYTYTPISISRIIASIRTTNNCCNQIPVNFTLKSTITQERI